MYRAPEYTGDILNVPIDVIKSMHLIRAEWRAGTRWYELTHDRFIEPILASNKVFNDELVENKPLEKELAEKERSRNRIIKGFVVFYITILNLIIFILVGFIAYH